MLRPGVARSRIRRGSERRLRVPERRGQGRAASDPRGRSGPPQRRPHRYLHRSGGPCREGSDHARSPSSWWASSTTRWRSATSPASLGRGATSRGCSSFTSTCWPNGSESSRTCCLASVASLSFPIPSRSINSNRWKWSNRSLGFKLHPLELREPQLDVESAFRAAVRSRAEGLFVLETVNIFQKRSTDRPARPEAPAPDELCVPRIRRRWGPRLLRCELPGHGQARGHLRGQDPQGRQTRRPAG